VDLSTALGFTLEPIRVSDHRQIAAARLSDEPTFLISRRRLVVGSAAAFLHLPARLEAQAAPDGSRILRARLRDAPASNAASSNLWGYDGMLPGPTLRIRQGEELRLRLINELAAPTSIHWHGVRVPNAMDGVPGLTQAAVAPGATFDYRFRPPDAGTYWYHALPGGDIDRGLHGAFIVEEARPVAVDRELVLVISAPAASDPGAVVVNGAARPDFAVQAGERLRVRLINATAASGVVLRFDGHAAWLVAIDGQPSEPFPTRDGRVALGPGSRIDLVVDASRAAGTVAPILAGDGVGVPVARLVYRAGGPASAGSARPEPPLLPPTQLPARIDLRKALRQDLDLAKFKSLSPASAPLFTVRRGRAVALTLRNGAGAPQVFHLHGHSFRHLDRLDDGWKPYWLDTFVIGADTERIAFVAGNPGKWLIESRTLDRPDRTGEAFFVVS
jgi:FtsP/CotA-like multicopper oxidase with cupredoxin domain